MTKEETREHILKVAAELFAQKGFSDASMNDIVAASQISKGGIYWHFKSKDEIIQAIFVQFFEMQLHFLESMIAQGGTVKERLLNLAETLGTMLDNAESEVMNFPHPLDFYTQAMRQQDLLRAISHHADNYLKTLATLIQVGIDAGEFAACDAEDAALLLLSTLDGLVLASTLFGVGGNLTQKLNFAMRVYIKGLERP